MKTPKTALNYLKLLIQIANDSVYDLKGVTEEEKHLIAGIRAVIQNELGGSSSILDKRNLKFI
jgi:hypothetical protein